MFKIRCFLSVGLLAALSISGPLSAQESSDSQMNILLIAVDDLKTVGSLYSEEGDDFLRHVYPDPQLRREVAFRLTPNIQRLGSKGVLFTNAYCASPACNPSRAALMTGIRPHVSGLVTNAGAVFFRDFEYQGVKHLANAITLPELLRQNGYYTASTGKIYHNRNSYEKADGPRSWDDWTNVGGTAGGKTRSIYSPDSLNWGQEGGDNATYKNLNDLRIAEFVATLFEEGTATNGDDTFTLPEDKPFFFAAGIFRPHLPFYATKDLLDMFPVEEMKIDQELLDFFTNDSDDLPEEALKFSGMARDENSNPVIGPNRFTDILELGKTINAETGQFDGWKDMLKHYFASCVIADRAIGRILDGLENSPYADNTIVIFWSDHNYHLGEKLHETKFTFWDDASRVNFIIADPRNPQSHGAPCFRPVSLVDIYPTVANIVGVELPDERITGVNLEPLLEDPFREWNSVAQTTFRDVDSHMIRTDRFKLIRYINDRDEVELYDMIEDPEEYHNLAVSPEYAEVLSSMLELMDQTIEANLIRN